MEAGALSAIIAASWMLCGVCAGFNLGVGWCRLRRSTPTPRTVARDRNAAEAPAPTPPRAERVKHPFAESGDNRSGNGTDNGDDDVFHADIVPQNQEAWQ